MKHRLSFLALILALAAGSTAPRSQTRVEVPQNVTQRVAAGETVNVIVGVEARFVPEGDLAGQAAVAEQRATVSAAVADAMSRAAAVGVTVGAAFERIPYFTARVNRAQLEALATTSGVASVQEDLELSPSINVSVPMVNAPASWTAGHIGAGADVAILDTGVLTTHPFFAGRVVSQACYSNALGLGSGDTTSVCPGGANSNTSGGGPCGANGCDHGTHVAGIALGANGPGGVNGVAPGAGLHAIQVFSQKNSDCGSTPVPCTTAYTSDIIRGLERVLVLKNGGRPVASVNMSLGGGRFFSEASCDSSNPATKAAIDNLRSVGVASIISSGNDAFGDSLSAPGCISTAVAVGATTRGTCPGAAGCHADSVPGQISVPIFSNVATFLDLYAPGSGINSSVLANGFGAKSGTSMAAPHVAGAWAVLKGAAPAASVSQVLAALISSGTPITEPFTGLVHPMINVNAARVLLGGGGGGTGPPAAPTNFTVVANINTLNMSWVAPAVFDLSPLAGAATNYHLLVRVASGGPIVFSLPLGNVTSFSINAPNGSYFLSVRATNAFGAGPESNVVPVTVPALPPPPGSPTGLVANVVGNSATFNWTAPTSGGPVANYVLFARPAPTGANIASLTLPPSPTSLVLNGIPAGIWYIRIAARNAGGFSAFSTNQVQITVAGPAPPAAPTLNAPIVSAGNTVALSWTAAAGATSYTLVVRLSPAGTPVIVAPVGAGTSIGFSGVPSGTYYLQIVANNAVGSSPPSNQVALVVP